MKYILINLFIIFCLNCWLKPSAIQETVSFQTQSDNGSNQRHSEKSDETDEQKAVRLAEEFIKINGYTDLPADKDKITYESVEFANNLDELLKERKNTLESRAYGFLKERKGANVWTVVFKYKNLPTSNKNGRAVTMDDSFQNLRVEHKDFILKFATKLRNERQ